MAFSLHFVHASGIEETFFGTTSKKRIQTPSTIEESETQSSSSQPKKKKARTKENTSESRGPYGEEYAIATTDTSFKQMLSIGDHPEIIISFLNTFVPAFRGDHVQTVTDAPVAIPPLKKPNEKQTFMDLHVLTQNGVHYIIEMQAKRHLMFDERVLFYASSTYHLQLSEKELNLEDWYLKLKPVISLQLLDYDTNRIRGISSSDLVDTLVERVKQHPLPEDQFTKHYILTDQNSGQQIDYMQIVQVELPRAEKGRTLFPPQENFTPLDWWLSILNHSKDYVDEVVEEWHTVKKKMPESIYNTLKRLDYRTWNPQMQREYREDITRKDLFQAAFEVERQEGKAEGKIEGRIEGRKDLYIKKMAKGKTDDQILNEMEITQNELEEIKASVNKDNGV